MKVGSLSCFCEHGHDFLVTQNAGDSLTGSVTVGLSDKEGPCFTC